MLIQKIIIAVVFFLFGFLLNLSIGKDKTEHSKLTDTSSHSENISKIPIKVANSSDKINKKNIKPLLEKQTWDIKENVLVLNQLNKEELRKKAIHYNKEAIDHLDPIKKLRLLVFFQHWAKVDQEEALRFAIHNTHPFNSEIIQTAVFGILANTHADECITMINQIKTSKKKIQCQITFLEILAEIKPDQAFEYGKQSKLLHIEAIVQRIFFNLTRSDSKVALKTMNELSLSGQRLWASKAIAIQMSKSNLNSAMNWVGQLKPNSFKTDVMNHLLVNLAKDDPEKALSFANKVKHQEARYQYISSVIEQWREHDAEAAMTWSMFQPDANLRTILLRSVAEKLIETEPDKIISILDHMNADENRSYLISQMVNQKIYKNPEQVFDLITSLPDNEKENAIHTAISSIAQFAPEKTLDLMQQLSLNDNSDRLVSYVASRIAEYNPEEFETWSKSLSSEYLRDTAVKSAYQVWATEKPEVVAEKLNANHSKNKKELIKKLANTWAKQDHEASYLWASSLPDSETRFAKMEVIAGSDDFEWSSDMYHELLSETKQTTHSDSTYMNDAITTGIHLASKIKDRESGLHWASNLGNPKIAKEVEKIILDQWLIEDPISAGTYIKKIEPSPLKNIGAKALADRLISMNKIDEATEWINMIDNKEEQLEFYKGIYTNTKLYDPENIGHVVEKLSTHMSQEDLNYIKTD